MKPTIAIIAGEVSGDIHGAALVEAIRRRIPGAVFFGIGGDEMKRAGVEVCHHTRDMAVMGLTAVLGRIGFFRRVFMDMLDRVKLRKPHMVILIDYPGFNLRFAARTHAMGIKTVYYICPQVWAWRRSRARKMAKILDRLITIFPFEAACFAQTKLKPDYVGHPLVDLAAAARNETPAEIPNRGQPGIALLPGSRAHVVKSIFPSMWQAAGILQVRHPEAGFVLAAPSQQIASLLERRAASCPGGPSRWSIVTGNTRQVLLQSAAALVASGTATVEASLMLCPMVIAYRASPLTYMLARMLVRIPHIGMVNVIAGREVCPEFIQRRMTPQNLAKALEPLFEETPQRTAMLDGLRAVNSILGEGGAADRAAAIVAEELTSSQAPQGGRDTSA